MNPLVTFSSRVRQWVSGLSVRMVTRWKDTFYVYLAATFAQQAGKTKLTWRMLFNSVAECDKVKSFAAEANEQNFDRLEAQLAKMA